MKKHTNNIIENLEELFECKKYDEIINLLTNKLLENHKDAELYAWRGLAWYNKENYKEAIIEFDKALQINPSSELAFYNRGLAWVAKKEYDKAIADYSTIIEFNSIYKEVYYNDRGIAWKAKKDYHKAINDYTEAIKINPNSENAYYNRGLAKKEEDIDLKGSKEDFERYLQLTINEDDLWAKYAKYYINELDVMIKDPELSYIRKLVNEIKEILYIEEECVHYTRIKTLRKLIIDESKFRIFEGNFMNDPSEGDKFFNFLKYKPLLNSNEMPNVECFSPKPFIGSFVTKDKNNDLNMWRFYGKEEGAEAKGCAITLHTQDFIEDIKNSLSNEKNKDARLDDESDISFYRVVYFADEYEKLNITSSIENEQDLQRLMEELKKNVNVYRGDNTACLEKYLNSIAFLFKSDAYKNENEVRLVVKGIEFKKNYDMEVIPPRIYIELEPIKKRVKQIILGPKVDNVKEWASVFYYRYEEDAPEIMVSKVPYK